MGQLADKYYTVEEYLALEEKAERKSEYFNGKIYLISGGSANHSYISVNTIVELSVGLSGSNCGVLNSDIRIADEDSAFYTYADAAVVCGPLEFVPGRSDTITNPILLAEVLSPSTRNYDRGEKFRFYRAIESLKAYLLIEQDEIYIEYYLKLPDGTWQLKTYNQPDQVIELSALGLNVVVERLYKRVQFPTKPPKRPRSRRREIPHPTFEN